MVRPGFHPLVVAGVEPLTDDSAAITFAVPDELAGDFVFSAGQSLTIRRGEERRSYSICAAAGTPPRIGVREVAGGAVSGWLVRELKAGDTVEVQAPSGTFTPDLAVPGQHVLIAAGSASRRWCRSRPRCWPRTTSRRSRCCTATGAATRSCSRTRWPT